VFSFFADLPLLVVSSLWWSGGDFSHFPTPLDLHFFFPARAERTHMDTSIDTALGASTGISTIDAIPNVEVRRRRRDYFFLMLSFL